ncbi:universal stress protein [Leeia sp. TBRC 13508]|uniref:Universal stress protein n=1 Tax=Leeia speluncae TaxID=2884804 RepID=A0ABS8D859_9NEIS|nr:universal stress protein [Leeia speluncae]MCB6184380.1 universal stress protein [Leeia speluncae]
MYQRIFVPVDESKTSNVALQEAIRFAQDQHAIIRLVHVVDLAQFFWGGAEFIDTSELQQNLITAGQKVLAEAEEKVKAAAITVDSQLHQTYGERIARVISDDAKAWNADIVVMGTHGKRGFDHLLLGSVAEGVMRMATTPLLMIRAN